MPRPLAAALFAALAAGCGGETAQPKFPDLVPAKGVVKRAGAAVTAGAVQFLPDPPTADFLVNAEVGKDGTFALSTVRTTDKTGERKPGAPPGKYKAVFQPPLGEQTAGGVLEPVNVPGPFEVKAGGGDIVVELPKK